jgi:hypothetical protein
MKYLMVGVLALFLSGCCVCFKAGPSKCPCVKPPVTNGCKCCDDCGCSKCDCKEGDTCSPNCHCDV